MRTAIRVLLVLLALAPVVTRAESAREAFTLRRLHFGASESQILQQESAELLFTRQRGSVKRLVYHENLYENSFLLTYYLLPEGLYAIRYAYYRECGDAVELARKLQKDLSTKYGKSVERFSVIDSRCEFREVWKAEANGSTTRIVLQLKADSDDSILNIFYADAKRFEDAISKYLLSDTEKL